MEQIKVVESFTKSDEKITLNFVVFMAIMFVTTLALAVVSVAPTLIILAAPALLMNLGWILFVGLL
jgi:hypothetical protein